MVELGRNEPCHCGSGKKYKKCHLAKDEEKERKALAKASFAPKPEAEESTKQRSADTHKHPSGNAGWLQKTMGKIGFFRSAAPRKAPGGSGK
jgi:hypothetical protein